jgi:hypothetical protein
VLNRGAANSTLRKRRRLRTDEARVQDRERKARWRLRRELLAAGLAPVELWVDLSKIIRAWLISKRLDQFGEQPAPAMIVSDLEKVVEHWADNQIDHLQKLRSQSGH